MAEVVTQVTKPAEFIEAAGKTYLTDLQKGIGAYKGADLSKTLGPQFIAGLDPLQQQAIGQAGGLGAYEPYLQQASALRGPTAYQAYMSPYQKDIIDTTLEGYDIQAQKGLGAISQQAIQSGAFGGGRQGVAEAEYRSQSDLNRAALQAQLLQQGFGQAQQLAAQQYSQQLGLAQAQPSLVGQQISGLSALGAGQQAQQQAQLGAQQQLAYQQAYQPLQAVQTLGSGITGLIAGYPQKDVVATTPSQSPLATGLGVASTLAGIYRLVS